MYLYLSFWGVHTCLSLCELEYACVYAFGCFLLRVYVSLFVCMCIGVYECVCAYIHVCLFMLEYLCVFCVC